MLKPYFSIGPISFHWYGLIIATSILIGLVLAKLRAHQYNLSPKVVDQLFWPVVIVGIVGARLYHVLDYWWYYSVNLKEILFIWQGGLAIYGALLSSLIVIYIFAKFKKIPPFKILDLAVPSVALGQSIGRWGNFVNSEGFGLPTNLPWGMFISPQLRPYQLSEYDKFHPVFLYESLADCVIFLILISLSARFKSISGLLFAIYVMLYSALRFVIEIYRFDTWVIGGVKVAQVVSIILLVYSLVLIWRLVKVKQNVRSS